MPAESEHRQSESVPPVGAGLQAYADGSYDPDSDVGGWGYAVYRDGVEIVWDKGRLAGTSNNAMELLSLLEAARWINANSAGERSTLWTDSAYAVNGCQRWRHIWKNWNWRKRGANARARSRSVPDAELWKAIDAELTKNPLIVVRWCKGHAGLSGNERADRLAEEARLCAGR
jgi:ribonuclease HI